MSDGKRWTEVQVEVPAELGEVLAAELAEPYGGVEIRDAETIFPTAADRATVVILCAPQEVDSLLALVAATLDTARTAGVAVDPVAIRQRAAHEDEWRDVWKQFFRVTRIGRRFVVRPSWEPAPPPGPDHVINLDPGRAFGTGAHPSTRLLIAALEHLAETTTVRRFLDLGCGSGILSIAAALLWPKALGLAVDLDPESAACTEENLVQNRIAQVAVRTGTLVDIARAEGPFDVVLANIQRDVLEELAPAWQERVAAPGGNLLLSGLLATDADPVQRRYESLGWRLNQRADEGEWASLWFSPPPA